MEQNPVLFLQKNTEHWDVTLPPEVSNEVTNFIILYFYIIIDVIIQLEIIFSLSCIKYSDEKSIDCAKYLNVLAPQKWQLLGYRVPDVCKRIRIDNIIKNLTNSQTKLCSEEIRARNELKDNGRGGPITYCEIPKDTERNCTRWTIVQWLFTNKPGIFGRYPGFANITGVIMTLVLTILVIFSLPYFRKNGHFQVNNLI